jgi:ribosome-binding protein aMBF1 (putative translation factor)
MGKVKAAVHREFDVQWLKVGQKKLAVMDKKEFDRLIDALDALEAERIASDPSDRTLTWDEIKHEFFPNRITEFRERKSITQKELARRLKVKQSTVSRMERPEANLTLATLRKVAKALRCTVPELIA